MTSSRTMALAAALVIVLAGCGIRSTGVVRAGDGPFALANNVTVTVYLVDRKNRLVPVVRPGLPGHPYHAVTQLGHEPTAAERRRGLRNAVPRLEMRPALTQNVEQEGSKYGELQLNVTLGRTPTDADRAPSWSRLALAQIACTAARIPGIRGVRLTGVVAVKSTGVVLVTGVLDGSGRSWELLRCEDFRDLVE